MNVAQLIQALKKMPRDAEVELAVNAFAQPATGARKLARQIVTVQSGGFIDLDPTRSDITVVIFSGDSYLADR